LLCVLRGLIFCWVLIGAVRRLRKDNLQRRRGIIIIVIIKTCGGIIVVVTDVAFGSAKQ